jgi:chaperonin GroES
MIVFTTDSFGTQKYQKNGGLIPVSVKEGDKVLLPEFGETQIVLADKE